MGAYLDALKAEREREEASTPKPVMTFEQGVEKLRAKESEKLARAYALAKGATLDPLYGLMQTAATAIGNSIPGTFNPQGVADFFGGIEEQYQRTPAAQYPETRFAGSVLPWLYASSLAPVKPATTLASNLLQNAKEGAKWGTLSVPFQVRKEPPTAVSMTEDLGEAAAGGAGIGAGLGLAVGGVAAARNAYRNWLARTVTGPGFESSYPKMGFDETLAPMGDEARQLQEATGRLQSRNFLPDEMPYRPAQVTQDPDALGVELKALGSGEGARQRAFHDNQMITALRNGWTQISNWLGKGIGPQTFGTKLIDAYDKTDAALIRGRRQRSAAEFGKARSEFGDERVVPVQGYLDTIDELIAKEATAADVPGSQSAQNVAQLRAAKQSVMEHAGIEEGQEATDVMVSVPWLQSRLAQLGQEANPFRGRQPSRVQVSATAGDRRIASSLQSALLEDMGSAPAGSSLAQARDTYRQWSEAIDELRQSPVGALFGVRGRPMPMRAASRFMAMKPDEMDSSIRLIDRADPELANYLRAEFIRQNMSKATLPAPAGGRVDWSMMQMLETMRGSDRYNTLFPRGSEARQVLDDMATVTQRINSTHPARAFSGAMPSLKEPVRAVSGSMLGMMTPGPTQSPLFVAGLAAEWVVPSMWRKAIMEPTYRNSLTRALDAKDWQKVTRLMSTAVAEYQDYAKQGEEATE